MIAANKRSIITLFYGDSDIGSHQVKIVLAEKEVPHEKELVLADSLNEDFLELGSNGALPTLVDRDLVLFEPRIILEYLDERFPHPPLMPVYPVDRAKSRLMMHRIENDWFSVLAEAECAQDEDKKMAILTQLRDEILSFGTVFAQKPYFLSDVFSLVDCYIAPILYRLQENGIKFTGAGSKPIKTYMERVFSRPSFISSIKSGNNVKISER